MQLYQSLLLVNVAMALCTFTAQAQRVDSTQFKSAKDYIRYKETTDPNITQPYPAQKIQLRQPPVTLYDSAAATHKKPLTQKCGKQTSKQ